MAAISRGENQYLLWGWERFFEELSTFMQDADRQASTANQAYSEYALERLQISIVSVSDVLNHLRSIPPSGDQQAQVVDYFCCELSALLRCLRDIAQQWQLHLDQYLAHSAATSYVAPIVNTPATQRHPGRPRFDITKEQLVYLMSMSFTWTQIAQMLGVSYMTVYRRRLEYGLLDTTLTGNITDAELKVVVEQMCRDLPTLGETMVWGHLKSMGFRVTRERVRHAIRETDPLHTALRWRGDLIGRRPYSVPGPNSLWHIGNTLMNVPVS